MKPIRQSLLLFSLMLLTTAACAQASWGYTIYFKIADGKGGELTPEEFTAKGYEMYDRGRASSELTYSKKTGYYRYRMSNTIYTLDYLVLLNKKDTMVLEHNTQDWKVNKPLKVSGGDITFHMVPNKKKSNHFMRERFPDNSYQDCYLGKVRHLDDLEQNINPLEGFKRVPFHPEAVAKKGKRPRWL